MCNVVCAGRLCGSKTPANALDLATLLRASCPVTMVAMLACPRMFQAHGNKRHDFRTHLAHILLRVVPLTQRGEHGFRTSHGVFQVGMPWVETELQADAPRHQVLDGVVASAHLLAVHEDLVAHHLGPPKQRPVQENALANGYMLFTQCMLHQRPSIKSSLAAELEETQQADEEQAAVLAKSMTTKNCENITEPCLIVAPGRIQLLHNVLQRLGTLVGLDHVILGEERRVLQLTQCLAWGLQALQDVNGLD